MTPIHSAVLLLLRAHERGFITDVPARQHVQELIRAVEGDAGNPAHVWDEKGLLRYVPTKGKTI